MAHDEGTSNKSGNRPFADVLEVNLTRRRLLKGSLATAVTAFFGGKSVAAIAYGRRRSNSLIDFEPVPVALGNGPEPTPGRGGAAARGAAAKAGGATAGGAGRYALVRKGGSAPRIVAAKHNGAAASRRRRDAAEKRQATGPTGRQVSEERHSYDPARKARAARTTGAETASRRRMSAGRKVWYAFVVALA